MGARWRDRRPCQLVFIALGPGDGSELITRNRGCFIMALPLEMDEIGGSIAIAIKDDPQLAGVVHGCAWKGIPWEPWKCLTDRITGRVELCDLEILGRNASVIDD